MNTLINKAKHIANDILCSMIISGMIGFVLWNFFLG